MPLLHTSGGLIYHLRAWRWRRVLWVPFHAEVKRWLNDWQPDASHLVLVGPSGGYALSAEFLARFDRISVLEPDPVARRLLQYRFPAIPFEFAKSAWLSGPEGFQILAQRYPAAAFLFCNLLGQTLVGEREDHARLAGLHQLATALQGRTWASWHDLASTARRPDRYAVIKRSAAESLENALAHFWQGGELEIHDHDCTEICPERPRQYAIWQLTPGRYHLVEWLHSFNRRLMFEAVTIGECRMNHEEVLAAMRQWVEKAVIGLNLCPFAKSVYVKNQVRFVISDARHLDGFLEDLDRELDLLAATDPAEIDTTLLIHPTLLPDFLDFNDFTIISEAAVEEHGLEGIIQVASFHPQFQFADTAPDDIGNFTNRAPYPTLHLIREESIARAVEAFPDAEEIFGRNIETLNRLGLAGWRALGLSAQPGKEPTD